MIVNLHEQGWEVIYHRAHATLAAQIAGNWHPELRPQRWLETIAAISHHDDLEKEWEGDHLTPAGAPRDFTLEKGVDLEKVRKLTQNAQYRGRWVAMLISMHMSFLTEGLRGESKEIDEFLDEQIANQQKWIEELEITKDDAAKAYAFFQWCDRMSLILCNKEIPEGTTSAEDAEDFRALEIAKDGDGQSYSVSMRSDGNITVKPWAFKDDKFTVRVEASYLDQLQFADNDELVEALQKAPIKTLEWTFAK
jgi:Protein of unknown function (DUF3891)